MSARKIAATVVGLVACVSIGYAINGLLALGSCGDYGLPPCTAEQGGLVLPLVRGIIVAVIATIAGRGWMVFAGVFAAVGVGALLTGLASSDGDLREFHQEHDLLLTPTIAGPPVAIGELDPPPWLRRAERALLRSRTERLAGSSGIVRRQATRILAATPFTQLANLTGRPAMSVPLHWTAAGLPLGVQLVARWVARACCSGWQRSSRTLDHGSTANRRCWPVRPSRNRPLGG